STVASCPSSVKRSRSSASSASSTSSTTSTSEMRNDWNGRYHSRSQCVCGTRKTLSSSLHRARQQTLDEVPLQREEHDQRHDHQQERRGAQQVILLAVRRQQRGNAHGERLVGGVWDEDERHQQVVPDPEELEDR